MFLLLECFQWLGQAGPFLLSSAVHRENLWWPQLWNDESGDSMSSATSCSAVWTHGYSSASLGRPSTSTQELGLNFLYPEEYDVCQLSPRLLLQNPIIPQTLNRASNAKPRVPPVTGQFLFILPGTHKAYMWNGNLTGQGKGSTGRETK